MRVEKQKIARCGLDARAAQSGGSGDGAPYGTVHSTQLMQDLNQQTNDATNSTVACHARITTIASILLPSIIILSMTGIQRPLVNCAP